MYKRLCFWKPFGSEGVNESVKLLNCLDKYFSLAFSSLLANLSYKKLVLVISEILGLVVNTLTSNYEYAGNHRDDLALPVHMLLSQKRKTFCRFFIAFFDSALRFEYFEMKSASYLKDLWSYWLPETCLIKCIKCLLSQSPLAVNLLTSP